jgi:hypothetical protein
MRPRLCCIRALLTRKITPGGRCGSARSSATEAGAFTIPVRYRRF